VYFGVFGGRDWVGYSIIVRNGFDTIVCLVYFL
jgi:hypothetical protein